MTLRELEQAATPAPWYAGRPHGPAEWVLYEEHWSIGEMKVYNDPKWDLTYPIDPRTYLTADAANANAALTVALRNAAPLLLDVVDAARAYLQALAELRGYFGSDDKYQDQLDRTLIEEHTRLNAALAALGRGDVSHDFGGRSAFEFLSPPLFSRRSRGRAKKPSALRKQAGRPGSGG